MASLRLLDLFCGAGGAAKGYHDAGFEVVGVDIKPQPRYPFTFFRANALEVLDGFTTDGFYQADWALLQSCFFDLLHASPPCQAHSKLRYVHPGIEYPELIEPTRELLKATGLPYVIENVEGAPLIDPVVLCGSHFDLSTVWGDYGKVGLRRHRLFESNFPIPDPGPHDHSLRSVPVYGHGPSGQRTGLKGPGHAQAAREVMGIDWMQRAEMDEAIPPAYTKYVGEAVMAHLTKERYALAA